MFRMLSFFIKQGVATVSTICPPLEQTARGLPYVTQSPCLGSKCHTCLDVCPTAAIDVKDKEDHASVKLDLGACIACGLCTSVCPTDTIVENLSTKVARNRRSDLLLTNEESKEECSASDTETTSPEKDASTTASTSAKRSDKAHIALKRSVAIRVVSTGCSACDLEIGASSNPVFDVERFGVQIVASPRAADVLMVTGPVANGMQTAVLRCYEAMPDPRIVIAAGTCAISGGVHKDGYAHANGLDSILPVDVYIPGCPPHPWNLIHGLIAAREQAAGKPEFVQKNHV